MSDGFVLVVDDDEDIRDIVQLVLESGGFSVQTAADGFEALERIQRHGRPAVILLDVMMPGLNGVELAGRLRSTPATADLPIVILSGDVGAKTAAGEVGANEWMAKPVEMSALLDVAGRYARPQLTSHPTAP